HQPHALEAPLLEVAEELPPGRGIFLAAFHHAQDLAVAVAVDADGHQDGHVADLPAPRPLQPNAIQKDVGMLALDRPVAPFGDAAVDLLVQFADRARAHARAPQGLGDVLDAAHGHAGQVHLDQGLLDAGLAPLIALDDLGLERQRPQPGHVQFDLAGLGLQLARVTAAPRVSAL